MDSLLRKKMHIHIYSKNNTKKTRDFVHEHPEAHSWKNLYLRLTTFRKAKPLNGDLQGLEVGFQEKAYFKIQNSRLLYSIITNSIHSKRLNWKKQICARSCPLSVEVMEFSCTTHRAEEFKGTCWSQMTCGSIVAISHHPHIQRGTHSQFTVPKHMKHSKGMGFGPWKLNGRLKIFPKQIKREITIINHSLILSNAFSWDLKFKWITSHSLRF